MPRTFECERCCAVTQSITRSPYDKSWVCEFCTKEEEDAPNYAVAVRVMVAAHDFRFPGVWMTEDTADYTIEMQQVDRQYIVVRRGSRMSASIQQMVTIYFA